VLIRHSIHKKLKNFFRRSLLEGLEMGILVKRQILTVELMEQCLLYLNHNPLSH